MYYKHETDQTPSITIRHARPEDHEELVRLAERDSSKLPSGELLVAAVGGELRVATAVASGETIADPFHPTAELARLISARAGQLGGTANGHRRGLAALRRGRVRTTPSPQPAGTLRTFS